MAVTLHELESAPAFWPPVTPYPRAAEWEGGAETTEPDPVISPETVWRMIERWINRRWSARSVTYTVEGPGPWEARLEPFTLTGAERWTGAAWEAVTLDPHPLGYDLGEGVFRIAGTAGDDSQPPEDAQEAWRRVHAYVLGNSSEHLDSLSAYAFEGGGERVRSHAARALSLSGAADLLRPYRRLR